MPDTPFIGLVTGAPDGLTRHDGAWLSGHRRPDGSSEVHHSMRVMHHMRIAHTGLHCRRTQWYALSAANSQAHVWDEHVVRTAGLQPTSVFAPRAPAGQLGCRARGWTVRLWAVQA